MDSLTIGLGLVLSFTLAGPARAQQWTAQRVLRIGEDEGVSFGSISSLAAAPDGRFFVLDRMESRVHVFSAAGKLERSFGRRGAGPGELSTFATRLLFSRGQLVVVDALNQRLSVFGVDGSFVRSRPLNVMQGMPLAWAAAGDRIVYLPRPLPAALAAQMGGVTRHTVFALDPRTDAAPDTLLRFDVPPGEELVMGATIKIKMDLRVPQLQLAGDGGTRVLLAASDTYRIRVLSPDGKMTGWLSRNVSRRRFTGAELARIKHQADSMMQAGFEAGVAAAGGARAVPRPEVEMVMPEYAPALTALVAGDRFVLVSRSMNLHEEPSDWDVLTYDNRLAGTVKFPPTFRPHALAGDRVYGVEKDAYDVESVAVYRIAPPR